MIKFFRKIRQQLLSDGKFSKYLIYALGEIVLVVIGILIALSINNWNEERKLHQEEIKLLKELRKDVVFAIEELQVVGDINQKSADYVKAIQIHLNEDLPYSEVLDTAFGYLDLFYIPYLPKTTYETIKVRGVDRIQNDSLKAKIVQLFDFEYQRIIDDFGRWEWSFSENTTQRMMINKVRRGDDKDDDRARPNDFDAFVFLRQVLVEDAVDCFGRVGTRFVLQRNFHHQSAWELR